MTVEDLKSRFDPCIPREKILCDAYLRLALFLISSINDSRELTIAIERLEDSYNWAIKGLRFSTNLEDDIDGIS